MRISKTTLAVALATLSSAALAGTFQYRVPALGLAAAPSQPATPSTPTPPPIAVSLNSQALTPAVLGKPYSYSLSSLLNVTGDGSFDSTQATWLVTSGLPQGISLVGSQLTGTPSQVLLPGTTVSVQATYKGQTADQNYTFKVAPWNTLVLDLGSSGGAATTVDLAGHTVSPGSGYASSTATAHLGTASGAFGTLGELSIPYSADFQFEGDFTMEAWVRVSSVPAVWQFSNGGGTGVGAGAIPFIGHGNPFSGSVASAATASNFDFGYDNVSKKFYFARRTGAGQAGKVVVTSSVTSNLSLNAWHHVSVSRAGGTLYFGLDGAMAGTATLSGPLNLSSTQPVTIGRTRGGDDQLFTWLNGYMQDVRVTNGYARYTQAYTPPAVPAELYN